jgi:polyhydroxyalkanoate synthesis regulator phasin
MIAKELERALFAGVGMIVVSREKVRAILDRMVAETKIGAEDAERLLAELADSGEDQWAALKESVKSAARRSLDGLDLPRKDRIEEMDRRLENLEKRMTILEGIRKTDGNLP